MTELELRRKVTDLANHYCEIGTWDWNDNLEYLIKVYNDHKPLARGLEYKPSLGGWCALFVSDMFILNGIADLITTEIGAYELWKASENKGQFKKRGTYVPKPGDIIFYSYEMTKDGKPYTQYHTGIVTNADASIIYTTEGNVQSRVLMKAVKPSDTSIIGFWAVDYASVVKGAEFNVEDVPAPPVKNGTYALKAVVSNGKVTYKWE